MGRYQTEAVGGVTELLGDLPTGGTVTIALYKTVDGSSVPLDASSCVEIGSTGIYRWSTGEITTPATTNTKYVYIMTDSVSGESFKGSFMVGGYVDSYVADIWNALTSGMTTVGSIGKKLADWALGTDNKALISTDAQDLSGTLDVNTKTLTSSLDLTSTMKASVNAEVDNAFDTAIPGTPTNNSINERIKAIDDKLPTNYIMGSSVQTDKDDEIDTLAARLTAARAGYLDELAAANIPADVDTLLARLSAVRAGYLDNLSAGAVAQEATSSNIQSRLPAALVGGKMDSDATAISGSQDAADKLEAVAEINVIGAAVAGTLSTTQMTTNLTEVTDNHYNGRTIIWTSGVLIGQATDIIDYDGATKMLTFTGVTEAPSAGDTFVIV